MRLTKLKIMQKKFEGTKVTVETFLLWKMRFDEELVEIKKQKMREDIGLKRLTGTFINLFYMEISFLT